MTRNDSEWLEHQLKRWMRPDAHRFVRPDWRRFVRPGFERDHPFALYERKYDPSQPRVPAGDPAGGRWTSGSGAVGRNDPRLISDATPDPVRPGAQYAQNRIRVGGRIIFINGQFFEMTPGQAARLAVADAQARDALARVRLLDPNWNPTPGIRDTVEGEIAQTQSEAQQAQARILELSRLGIGPGPFACESIPARGPGRDFTPWEREQINRIGSETGCHTCGIRTPGTLSGNFILDHQIPNALNLWGLPQRLFPHCVGCSNDQGYLLGIGRGLWR
jgi:hypothetical protein